MKMAEMAAELDTRTRDFYRHALIVLTEAGVPFLVGGAYALARYAGIVRHTKDFDVMVRPDDAPRALGALEEAGYDTDLTFPHWLGKAYCADAFVDVIFRSGNGLGVVDDAWLAHGRSDVVLDMPVKLVAPEEMIWHKAFVMERERFDGADILHLLRERASELDWPRLLGRFGEHWRVLLGHLVFFGYVYPAERNRVPAWVYDDLLGRLSAEMSDAPREHVCRGTLLSREQYLTDVSDWGYRDPRLGKHGTMSRRDVAHWTAAIDQGRRP
jgi:hypothetical protein